MTEQEAKDKLYQMWENGEVPNNFTEDNSFYSDAIRHLMTYGYLITEDLF